MHAWEWPADRPTNAQTDVDAHLGYTAAPLWAIERFVDGRIDESAFERWLRCCLLVRPGFDLRREKGEEVPGASTPCGVPKPAWAIVKLAFAGMPVSFDSESVTSSVLIRLTPAIAASLAAGNGEQGMRLATQRLRSAGLPLLPLNVVILADEARRIAASLLFPLEPNAVRKHVLPSVLRPADALSAG
jgi:CRISPR-associated protein Csx17